MTIRALTSDELLEHVSRVIANDLDKGYELVHVNTVKEVTKQSRTIEIELRKR